MAQDATPNLNRRKFLTGTAVAGVARLAKLNACC